MIEEITVYKSDLDPDFTFYTKNEAVKFEETYKVFYDLDEELQGIIKKCYAKEIDKSAAQDAAIDIFYNKAKPALLKRVESFSAINLVQFNATTVERGYLEWIGEIFDESGEDHIIAAVFYKIRDILYFINR